MKDRVESRGQGTKLKIPPEVFWVAGRAPHPSKEAMAVWEMGGAL